MDFINQVINWIETNWATFTFGGISLGTVITTLVFAAKMWISNKVQGTKYEDMWNNSQKSIKYAVELYEAEKAKNEEKDKQIAMASVAQTITFDILTKLALSSKMDTDDKTAVVASIEKYKRMSPDEIVQTVQQTAEQTTQNLVNELNEAPEKTVMNIVNSAGSLLDKYNKPKEG